MTQSKIAPMSANNYDIMHVAHLHITELNSEPVCVVCMHALCTVLVHYCVKGHVHSAQTKHGRILGHAYDRPDKENCLFYSRFKPGNVLFCSVSPLFTG